MMKKCLFLFSVVFLLVILPGVSMPSWAADGAYLSASFDKNKITIGDKVKLIIRFDCSKGTKIVSFEPKENLKDFEIKNYKISNEGKKHEYTIVIFSTGTYQIQPFKIKFATADGKEAESQSNILELEVASLLDKESASDIKDIKPPVNLKLGLVFYVVSFIILLLLTTYLIYKHNRSKTTAASILEEIIDPYQYIISELQKLQASNLITDGKIKELFIQLSFVVRVYLSKVFVVNVLDMTTTETVKTLRAKGADREFLSQLQGFLENADLVKFAKYIPDRKEIETIFEDIRTMVEIVRRTRDKGN